MWLFDQTNMVAAKQILGGRACIAGNVPTFAAGGRHAGEVEKYVTNLLDDVCQGWRRSSSERRRGRRRQA